MIERVEFEKHPPESVRLAFCEWMRHHGIDPRAATLPGWVERDTTNRTICYLAYRLDARGVPMLTDDREDAVRYVHRHQLEAEPSPFPVVE